MARFFKWDFDNQEVIEYEREGECNNCGQCCTTLIRYELAGRKTGGPGKLGDTMDDKGVWSEYKQGRTRRFAKLTETGPIGEAPCSKFVEGRCAIHEKKSLAFRGELAMCKAWPMIPEHVTPFDQCSYKFTEIGRWRIDDVKAGRA